MIGTLRKHQQWFWWLVIGATIYTFVLYFNPSSRYSQNSGGGHQGSVNLGSLFGEPVTPDQWQIAVNEAKIYYKLQANEWPTTQAAQERMEDIARTFLLVDAELRHNHITVTPEAAARFTKQLVGLKPTDPLTQDMLGQVLNKLLAGTGGDVTISDFYNFVHLSAGQQYLTVIFGMTGQLITPKEAESFYRRDNEPMITEVGLFPSSNYVAMLSPTTNEINDFYGKRQAQYRVPEQIALNYVEFPVTNFTAEADKTLAKQLGTNLDTKIDEIYVQQDPSTYRDETGTNILSPAAAKAKIKEEIRKKEAQVEARKAAIDFANRLMQGHDDQHPYTTDDIFQAAKGTDVAVHTTPFFDERTGPEGLEVTPRELHMIFNLSSDDPDDKDKSRLYLTTPLVNDEGAYILGLRTRLPSRIRPLSEIRDQVVQDYREAKALELSRQAGQRFEEAAKESAAQNKSFAQLCQDQGVRVVSLPAFSVASNSIPEITDHSEAQQIVSVAYSMPTGRMSPFVPTSQGGFVLYVKQRLPVDEAKMKEQLPNMLAMLRQRREVEAFTQWLNREGQLHAVFPPREKASGAG